MKTTGGLMKTNLDKFFKADTDHEKNGVWFDISNEIGFLIRPFNNGNPKTKSAMATLYKPFARQIEMGTMDMAKQEEIQIKLFINVCLVDWKGVEIDGKIEDYTPEKALKFLLALPELFATLWKHSTDFTNYREELGN
jgi:hypothetical protein